MSLPRVFPTRLSLAFLFLLAAAALATMPAVGQDQLSSSAAFAGPVLSGQVVGTPHPSDSLQPGGRLQPSSLQASSVQASETGAFGPRTHSPVFSGAGPVRSRRAPVLRPVLSGRALGPRLRAMLQQGAPDAEALQRNARVLQRTASLQSDPTSVPPHRRRWDAFQSEVISFQFVSGSVLGGTITHLTGNPEALDRDTRGYLARVGTITGSRLVATGVRHGVSAALGLKLKSPELRGPLGARLKQAVLQELTTRTTSGQRVPAVAETAGTYGAILTCGRLYHGQWRPGQAATSTAIAVGFKVAWATSIELIKSL